MNRLGIDHIKQLNKILRLTKNSSITVEGIFSHFFTTERQICKRQYERFLPFVMLAKNFYPKIISHISSSGGVAYPEYNLDMVRVGILMYGYSPNAQNRLPVLPCLKIYARKLCDRHLKKRENLLYGNYNLQTCANISIIKYGYADGGDRSKDKDYNNRCMDLSAVKKCKKYKLVLDNAEKLAKRLGTISYDVLVKYTARCRYRYEDNCR
jgi:alanine racemase